MPVPTETIKAEIVNAAAKRALGVETPSSADGVLIVRDHPDGGPSPDQWQLVPVAQANRTYVIRNARSGKVLDNPGTADRKVRQWTANNGKNQQWRVIPVEGEADLYRIECVSDGAVLDLADPVNDDGTRVTLRKHDEGAEGQRWRFTPAAPERDSEPVLRWTPVSHWNGRQSWRLAPSTTRRPTPDATPSFSDARLVLDRFGWDEGAGSWRSDGVSRPPSGGPGWRAGTSPRFIADVTGRGRADIVALRSAKGVVTVSGRGDGTFEDVERVLLPFTIAVNDARREDLWSFVDVNGDGRLDAVVFRADGVQVSRQDEQGRFAPMGAEPVVRAFGHGDPAGGWRAEKHPRFLVDTTGDGRVDIVGFHEIGVRVSRQDEQGRFAPVGAEPALRAFGHGDQAGAWRTDKHPRFLVDTTGDGRVDIVGIHDSGVQVSLQDEAGAFAEPRLVLADFGVDRGWRTVAEHPRHLVRTTAGGALDIVGFGPQGVVVARGKGDGTFEEPELVLNDFGQAQGWSGEKHLRLLADLTGDGNPDIVGFGDEGVWVSPGRGGGRFDQARLVCGGFGHDEGAGGWRVDRHPRFLADITGDGTLDIIGFGGPGVHVARNLARRFVSR
ncbi:RICIN domain-containing protein [Saccharothrix obliqua]|uniref:RICIN domain-containing protein n=1 Tax=Saccharothrix obliqua TaxID=2861747 RepID=UPI001C5F9151|nr:RICIN domain-containing protein [Saccharothrix obliqua]MBW4722369.1 VCBS repeat-containing protein [Saccharothrix obliqua]